MSHCGTQDRAKTGDFWSKIVFLGVFGVFLGVWAETVNLDYSSTRMKVLLFAAGQHDAEKITKNSVFIPVALRRDDSNPSAALFGARRLSIQLHPARLASGPDLSRA